MITFKNKTAIVTGAGSGIGLALSRELIARGAKVWLTDIDESAIKNAATELGLKAHAALLDVRDASSIKEVVEQVIQSEDKLDFMFNNAGIGIGGEMHKLDVEHFDRIIDVNIRGVMNGIAAVYPIMVNQGHGCIVNTASLAGLIPAPFLTAYAMTKHAIVGLSKSLRIEGRHYGVQVNTLCPAAIETPLLDSTGPNDLKAKIKYGIRDFLSNVAPPYPADKFATFALDGLESNTALIVAPFQARAVERLSRITPRLVSLQIRQLFEDELEARSSE